METDPSGARLTGCESAGGDLRRFRCRTWGWLALHESRSQHSPIMEAGKPLALFVRLALSTKHQASPAQRPPTKPVASSSSSLIWLSELRSAHKARHLLIVP
jgi:predicted component of type VI protein secretion system